MTNTDPFKILLPAECWAPSQNETENIVYEKLAVCKWRENNYEGASETSKSLLNFWFNHEHLIGQDKFCFFFAQREAIESIIYLYEVAKAKDKYELMRFDSSEPCKYRDN